MRPISIWRIGLKNLKREERTINALYKYVKAFRELQRGSVIKLDTFHLLMATNILENGLHIIKKSISKDKKRLEKNVLKYKRGKE